MTTTSMFTGLDPEGRSSSRVLRPPGGGSSFVFGASDNKAQPARRHKMASNIFGIPDKDPLPAPPAQEIGAPAGTLCGDSVDSAAERTCPPEDCSDNAEYMVRTWLA
ncbi:jupiter microtubule associated homolog 1 [Rhinophrynus dorsalis]